ncbi:MAG: hypothetical protein J7604_03560 [Sporocytophaga sp.]|uniref:hypothetical protein n=1 Tax=Sporocytophaga sp. TaxID=2231183 RepID=UPI001B0780ED|nr:hypothetical protein [Sporocytophaga sp.]MBO9699258.1 hypothetical protein [Sporocytophaga sp.]
MDITPVVFLSPKQGQDTKFHAICQWLTAITKGKDYSFSLPDLLDICSQLEVSPKVLYSMIAEYCTNNDINLIIAEEGQTNEI